MRGPDAYPTVSGAAAAAHLLTRRHPDICRMRLAGQSRAGRPLWLLSVGHGRRHVLVVAGAQPDEQAGGATVLWLAEQAVHDRIQTADADLTWDFLLCLDPDGTLLNQTGPAGPRPAAVHYRHTYRPAAAEQPECAGAFRAPGDELPESRALLAVIDELRPVLQCSLHGTEVGGGRLLLTAGIPGLPEPFGKYAAELDIPLQTGTHDTLYWLCPGPGVYVAPSGGAWEGFPGGPEQQLERELPGRALPEQAALPERAAGSTWCRPHRYGGLTALIEAPMWATRRVADPAPHPEPAHAVAVLAARLRKDGATAASALDRARPLLGHDDGPLLRGVDHAVGVMAGLADDYEGLAAGPQVAHLTMAHVAALDIAARRVPLHAAGMLLRLLDEERFDEEPNSGPSMLRARLERRLDAGARDLVATADARWVPVGDQVELQVRAVRAAVERVG